MKTSLKFLFVPQVTMLMALISFFSLATNAQEMELADSAKNVDKLLTLSFEDLMNVRVVTPTRNLLNSKQAPATVRVVTRDQIKLRGYRNLAEILNDLPDIQVNDKSEPQFYNVMTVRGISRQDHFVVMLDGIRISSPTNEPLPILENFPIYLAKQIEVVYGPGSALYGADAMACVINIITQKADDNKDIIVTSMIGTHGYSNTSALYNKKLKRGFSLAVGSQYSYDAQPDFSKIYKDDFDMTSQQTGFFNTAYGPVTVKATTQAGYDAPIKTYNIFSSIDKEGFSLRILHHYAEVPTSTTMLPNNAVYNKDVFYGQSVSMASASYSTSIGKMKSVSSLTGSFYRVNPESNYRNLYGSIEHGYKYGNGSMIKLEQQLNYSFSKKLGVTGGVTYELFHSIPKSPELQSPVNEKGSASGVLLNSAASNNPDGIEVKFFPLVYTNIGSYIQAQYSPIENISFTTGIRHDYNSRFGSTFNPRIGAVFTPLKNTTIKTLYGTAFWAPSPMTSFDSYGSFYTVDNGITYQSDFLHLPNPDLKPMKSHTLEVSIHQRIRRDLSLSVTAFTTDIHGIIADVSDNGNTNLYNSTFQGWPVDYIEVAYNKGTQQNYGGNFTINRNLQINKLKLQAYSSISYTDGKVAEIQPSGDLKEIEQGALTPWQFRFGIDGSLQGFHFSARLIQRGEQRTMSIEEGNPEKRKTIDGYSLLNLSAGYTYKDKATVFVNVQNALDQRYRNSLLWAAPEGNGITFSSSYQDPMRIMAGVRLGF